MELSLGAAKKGRWRSLGALLFSAFVLAVLCAEWLLVVQPARVNSAYSQRSRLAQWLVTEAGGAQPSYNWSFYRQFNELQNLSLAEAQQHYLAEGQDEGRITAPFHIRMQYRTGSGLCNQLYGHIHGLLLARALGSGVGGVMPAGMPTTAIVPVAWSRSSFGHRHSSASNKREVFYSPQPIGTLLDVERMQQYWGARGLVVEQAPLLVRVKRREKRRRQQQQQRERQVGREQQQQEQEVYRYRYLKPTGGRCIAAAVRRKHPLKQEQPLAYLHKAKAAIAEAARPTLIGDPSNQVRCVLLNPDSTFLLLETASVLEEAREAALGLFFNSTLEALAEEIVAAMGGNGSFDGLHLRLERDSEGWHNMMAGGAQAFLQAHYDAMAAANFSSVRTVYAASGLLSYNASDLWAAIQANITRLGLARAVTFKEKLLPPSKLQGLHTEQLALLDLLVLLRSQRLVGFAASTFSYLLAELRALRGHAKGSSLLVNPMGLPMEFFEAAARFSDPPPMWAVSFPRRT